jgi:DamX protein
LIIFQDKFNAWLKPAPQTGQPQVASPSATLAQNTQIDEAPSPAAKPQAEVTLPLEIPAKETQQEKDHAPEAQEAIKTETPAAAISETTPDTHFAPTEAKAPEAVTALVETSKPAIDKKTATAKPAQVAINTTKPKPAKKAGAPHPKAPSIPADLPGFRAAWILKQTPEHYTLQLVAGNNLKTLRSFIRRHKPAEPLAIYGSIRKGKPWFGLIQQSYASKQIAIDARSRLPDKLRRQKPWIRTFASLQKDLQQAH